jgi:cardiolipin synthase
MSALVVLSSGIYSDAYLAGTAPSVSGAALSSAAFNEALPYVGGFGIAASTDWVDGQIARRTNQVSRLGQLLDPAVDRILMITGVLGVFLVGRLPLWMILLVLVRDLTLLLGGYHLLRKYKIRVPVVYVGKVATTFLYIGFAGLILNMPLLAGLGYVDYSWLPLFNHDMYSWGFWFIYAGLFCAIISTTHYIYSAMKQRREVLERSSGEAGDR